jgi:hypothetical protein
VQPKDGAAKAKAEELAKQQEAIKKELLELATRNKERSGAEGQKSIERASKDAEQAQGSLDQEDLSNAEQHEEEVQRDLEQAKKELSKEEEQYQRLRQDELLFKIAEEVDALLKAHQAAMKETREIDAAREGDDRPSRAQRLRLKRISRDEQALAVRSGEIGKAIADEQSVVFAETLDEMRLDLERIAKDLDETGDFQTGPRVQALQQNVEERAQWLAEALKAERDRRKEDQKKQNQQQQQQQPQDQEQKKRLVPDEAELRLLKHLDVDLIDQVNALLKSNPEIADGKTADPIVLEEIQRLADRHERITKLFTQFRERLGVPPPEK